MNHWQKSRIFFGGDHEPPSEIVIEGMTASEMARIIEILNRASWQENTEATITRTEPQKPIRFPFNLQNIEIAEIETPNP